MIRNGSLQLVIGAILGLVSVAFGSYAQHGLRPHISAHDFESIATAVRYNQIYAVLICAIALAQKTQLSALSHPLLGWIGFLFTTGAVLFCFSIYIAILFNQPSLKMLAPIGGSTLMLGWFCLAVFAFITRNR